MAQHLKHTSILHTYGLPFDKKKWYRTLKRSLRQGNLGLGGPASRLSSQELTSGKTSAAIWIGFGDILYYNPKRNPSGLI